MNPFFSIVTVTLNAGDKLLQTMKNIEKQTFQDYEVIIKDGNSKDGSVEALENYLSEHAEFSEKVRIFKERDKSIYEGMNQAISHVTGEYLIFMNCGDYFYEEDTLYKVQQEIQKTPLNSAIYYGNLYDALRGQVVSQNPHMDAFGCYRNVPCHQSCFYHKALFTERGYDLQYLIRADYEHFLWCFFEKKAATVYMPIVIASYEGGGFSETGDNLLKSKKEHQAITKKYMTKGQLFKFKAILLLTLAPLRTKMAQSRRFSGIYNKFRKHLYRK